MFINSKQATNVSPVGSIRCFVDKFKHKLHPIIIKSVGKLPYFHFILFTLKTYVAFQSTFMNAAGKSVSFKKHDRVLTSFTQQH